MANVIHGGVDRSFEVLPSSARTATPDTHEFELPAGVKYLTLVIDITAVTATPLVTVTVAGVDRISGKTWTVLASAVLGTVATTLLRVGPALTAAVNLVANDMVPSVIRITSSHGDADSATYSIAGHVA